MRLVIGLIVICLLGSLLILLYIGRMRQAVKEITLRAALEAIEQEPLQRLPRASQDPYFQGKMFVQNPFVRVRYHLINAEGEVEESIKLYREDRRGTLEYFFVSGSPRQCLKNDYVRAARLDSHETQKLRELLDELRELHHPRSNGPALGVV